MRVQKPYSTLRLLGAVLLPLCAAGLQLLLLAKLPPLTWLFFYPAVFLSAWLGGLAGGLIAAGLSALLSVYIFMPPYWSWQIADMRNAYSAGIFLFMGGLFSVVFERLHRSTAELLRIKALELEINQNRLNQALHAASAGIWEWDLNNNQNYWDESLWQLYGLQPFSCQASYDLWLTTVHPDDGPAAQEAIRQAVKKNLELKLEWRLAQLFDGKERWLMSRGQPEFDANGQPTLYRGIVIDISDRKCAEAHLQDQEQWLSFALGSLQAGVWELKLDTLVARRTLKHDQIFGYAQLLPEWSYELFLEHVIAEDRDSVDRLFRMANAEQSNWSFDCRIRRADGEIRWIWASGQHKFDACGQAVSLVGIMQDITERKQVEDALQQQERLLADSQAVAHIGSWAVNLTNGRISWSEETYRLHGLSPKTDKPPPADQFAELLHVEDRPRLRTWIDGLKTGNQENGLEFRTREINGINRWLLAFAKTDRDKQGTPIRIIGTVQDISDRKRLLADLQRWADAFRYCAHGIVIGNPDTGLIITCNPAFAALLGFSGTEEAEGFPILSLYPPEKLDQIKAHIKQADQFGSCRYESVYERRNGSKTDVQVDLVSVKDATDGKVIYRVATLQDISARKRFEETLRLQSRALEAAANAIIISTADGVIEWVNPAYTAMTGFKDIEVVGKRPEQLATLEAQNQEDYRAQWQNIHNGSVWHGEMINYRKDGSLFAEELSITPVFNEQGDIEHVISIKQDITERKRQQAELMEYRDHLENLVDERTRQLSLAREEAERLSQVKSRFLANMSHEIRTPMNAVLGFCYLLQQRSLDADTLELVRKIHSAGRSLLAIINDILDFSKIEAGKLEIEMVPFQLSEVLDHLAALMSSSANNKNLELIISPAFDADELIGDGLRLQQVLVNLISNAIKFTEQGEVELKVSIDSETGDQQHLRFTVRDTGIGISSAQQQEIFSAFTQADNTISRRFGGSGLGLAICQQLLKLMGGELFVNSRLGQGSEFWFVLPLQRNPSAQRSPSQMADLHLLVVDDSSIAREALSLTAQSLGWHVDQAESGETAIAQTLTQVENLHPYDVILLDWKMPGLDGLATAQAIRETLSVQADDATATPIVLMITAYSREELLAQTGINHIDAFLSKPLTPSSLYTAVSGVLHDRLGENLLPPILSSAKPSHAIPGVRVLVVDDSDMNREVALRILESEGAVVSQAKDGQEALEWLSAHADAIDIVLMDVQMPRMDGYTATRQIRRNPLWRDLPIVALTAGAFTNLQDAALESGMNDFVAKPFNVPLMLSVIQRLTGCQPETTAALAVDKQHARLDGADNQVRLPVVNVNSQDFNQPGINVAAGLAIWGEKAAYQAYLARFVEQYRDAGRDIAQAATHGDEGAAAALAHKLKGVAYNLALTNVAARSVDIETALNDGRPVSDAALLLQAAIDEAAVSVSAWLTADPLLDENTENLATLDYNQADVKNLLVEFLAILDQDSPGLVDPLLARLENLLGAEPMTAIKAQIREFNFRAAEQLTKALIFKIENPNIP